MRSRIVHGFALVIVSMMLMSALGLASADGANRGGVSPESRPGNQPTSGGGVTYPYLPSSQTLVNGTQTAGNCGSTWSDVLASDSRRCTYQEVNKAPASPTSLLPNANGDTISWTVSGTAPCNDETNEWKCLNDNPNDGDTTYLRSTATTTTDSIENLGTVSFASSTVSSVVVSIWCRKTASLTVAVQTLVKTHGILYAGTSFDCPNSATYGTTSTTYVTNPNTGSTWTQAEIDAFQAGCRDADTTNREVRCSEVRVDVNFTPPPGVPTALLPEANGDTTSWTVSGTTGCNNEANEWDCVNDNPNDGDGTYLKSTAKTVTDSIENLGTVNFNGATVTSVVVNFWCRKTASNAVAVRTLIKTHGTLYAGASDFDCPNSGTYGTTATTYNTNPNTGAAWTQAEVDALQAGCRDNDGTTREVRCSEVRVDAYLSAQYAIETRFAWSSVPTTGTSWVLNVTCQRLNPGAENVLVQVGQGGSSPSSWRTAYTCNSDADQSFNAYALSTVELNTGAPVVRFWDNQQGTDIAQGTMTFNVLRIDWTSADPIPTPPSPPTAPAFIGANVSSPNPPAPASFADGDAVHNTSAVMGPGADLTFRIPLPDLVIANLTGAPEYAEYGELIVLAFEAQNIGEVSVANATVSLYDGAVNASNVIGTVNVTLPDFDGNGTVNWTGASPGNHTVIALADSSGVIAETNETNNARSITIRVAEVSVLIPDLTVDFAGSAALNGSAVVNATVGLTASVRNDGGAPAYNFVVEVTDVTGNGSVVVGSFLVGILNPSDVATYTFGWTPTSGDFGLIKIVADSGAAVTEQTKGNNVRVTTFPIEPDYNLCPVDIPGDWDIYNDQEMWNTLVCVEHGNVFIHGGGTLALHTSRLLLRFPLSESHVHEVYVFNGGTLLTDCQSWYYGAAQGSVNDRACDRIYSSSSDYRYAFKTESQGHVYIGANGASYATQVDFLGGSGFRDIQPGGFEIYTPFFTANRLSIRWPENHGLYMGPLVVIPAALNSLNVFDAGSGGNGGAGVLLREYAQITMSGGGVSCSQTCASPRMDPGIWVPGGAALTATGITVAGSRKTGIHVFQGRLSLTQGSLIEAPATGVWIDTTYSSVEIRDSVVRKAMVGILIQLSGVSFAPVIVTGNTVDVSKGPAPYTGWKGIVADTSSVSVLANSVGVSPDTEVRRQDTGISLRNTQGTVSENTIYQATYAGIYITSSSSSLLVSGGLIDDLSSKVDPADPSSPTPCGVRVFGAGTTPIVDSVTVVGRTWGVGTSNPIGICAHDGANPTIRGPGATPGAHIEWVFVGVSVQAASATIQGVRVERTVVGGVPRNFALGICVVGNIGIDPTVTIDGAQILNGMGVGVDVGSCSGGSDTYDSSFWAKATIQNSLLHIDPSLRTPCPPNCFNPGNRGIWVHGTSTANILQNIIEYFDVEQLRITGASTTSPPQVIGNTLRDLDYSSGALPDNWKNIGLMVVYDGGTVVVSGNQFHDGLWGISGDPNGPNTLTLTIDDRSGPNVFDHNRRVGVGCSGGPGACVVTVVHNEFTRIRGVSIVAGTGTWTINRNNVHDNGGDGGDDTPVGAVSIRTSGSVQFVGNSVVNTRTVDGFGSGVGMRVDSPAAPVISPNLFQNNGIALDLNSNGAYQVTNNQPGASCTAQGLSDCGFRGNDLAVRVENWAPRGPITSNVVDGQSRASSMGIAFEALDVQTTYDDSWGNVVINNGFGIVARDMPSSDYRFRVHGLTSSTVLSGNGYALFAYEDATVQFGGTNPGDANVISGNGWAVGVQQSGAVVTGNQFTDQTQGGIWVGGRPFSGFAYVEGNTITHSGARTCSSPPLSTDVKGIFVTSVGGTYANVFVRNSNVIQRMCFGIYAYDSDIGTSEGVHDNTITDVAQGVSMEVVTINGQSTFHHNMVQTVDYGYVVKNAQPTIRDHIAPTYGILDFSKYGVYVTGSLALPIVQGNTISTSVTPSGGVTPYGVYISSTTAQVSVSTNTVTYAGPLTGAFVGVFLDHAVAHVTDNMLSAPSPSCPTFFGGQGIIAQDLTTAVAQSVIERNVVTNYAVGISVSGYVNAIVGGSSAPQGNIVNGGGFRGIYSSASTGSSLQVRYNLLQPTSTPADCGGVSYGLAANGGLVQSNDVTKYFYGIHITCCVMTGVALTVKDNAVHGVSVGIIATNTAGFSIIHNDIHDNAGRAIMLWSDTSNAQLDHNNIYANNGGAQYGDQAADFGTGNHWDDGSIGNYWGGSNPPVPVIIAPNGVDNHPATIRFPFP